MISSHNGQHQDQNAVFRERIEQEMQRDGVLDLNDIFPVGVAIPQELDRRVRWLAEYSPDYAWPFIRQTLHQFLLSRMPLDQIAQKFNVSLACINKWKRKLESDFAHSATTLPVASLVVESLEALREAKAAAWREYFTSKSARDKAQFLQLAMKVEGEIGKLLQATGQFDENPFKKVSAAEVDPHVQGAQTLAEMAREFLAGPSEAEYEEFHRREAALKSAPPRGDRAKVKLKRGAWLEQPDDDDDIVVRDRRRPLIEN